MGEPEAIAAIKAGKVIINGTEYLVTKHPKGHCDGCDFLTEVPSMCPQKALDICCTGGCIMTKKC